MTEIIKASRWGMTLPGCTMIVSNLQFNTRWKPWLEAERHHFHLLDDREWSIRRQYLDDLFDWNASSIIDLIIGYGRSSNRPIIIEPVCPWNVPSIACTHDQFADVTSALMRQQLVLEATGQPSTEPSTWCILDSRLNEPVRFQDPPKWTEFKKQCRHANVHAMEHVLPIDLRRKHSHFGIVLDIREMLDSLRFLSECHRIIAGLHERWPMVSQLREDLKLALGATRHPLLVYVPPPHPRRFPMVFPRRSPSTLPGLTLLPNAIHPTQETALVDWIDRVNAPWTDAPHGRRVQQYESRYDYQTKTVHENGIDHLPSWIWKILCDAGVTDPRATKPYYELSRVVWNVIINEYRAGMDSIAAHVDNTEWFGEHVWSLSLLTPTVMRFQPTTATGPDGLVTLDLPPRSLLELSDESRYEWTHEIRATDVNARRLSITMRTVRPHTLDTYHTKLVRLIQSIMPGVFTDAAALDFGLAIRPRI